MIPSRSTLAGWTFGGISVGAGTVKSRGAAIESAASSIRARCDQLPTLQAWSGKSHSAAQSAFDRAKDKGTVVGAVSEDLSETMTTAYWSLQRAKDNLSNLASSIEEG